MERAQIPAVTEFRVTQTPHRTFSRAWVYPDQKDGWQLMRPEKLGAWYLLMYISFILVAALNRPREKV